MGMSPCIGKTSNSEINSTAFWFCSCPECLCDFGQVVSCSSPPCCGECTWPGLGGEYKHGLILVSGRAMASLEQP